MQVGETVVPVNEVQGVRPLTSVELIDCPGFASPARKHRPRWQEVMSRRSRRSLGACSLSERSFRK
jgi:hypothetical protein